MQPTAVRDLHTYSSLMSTALLTPAIQKTSWYTIHMSLPLKIISQKDIEEGCFFP